MMKRIVIVYAKISIIITLIESLYLILGFIYPSMLKDFNEFNIVHKAFFYIMAYLFFVCFWNAILLFFGSIIMLFTRQTVKYGIGSLIVCIIFYFVTKETIGYGL
jgi:preprotein translocase subunit SecY